MIKFKKSFTLIKFFVAIIIILITMSTINNANATYQCEWGKCWGWDSRSQSLANCAKGQAMAYNGSTGYNYVFPQGCYGTCYSSSCTCGADGAAYCTGDYAGISGLVINGSPPAAATCSTGPDGKTYCLASGSATYSSGVSACYNKTNCLASTPPAVATCQVGYDGKTYCPGSYPSGISSCYDKPNCINNETPPTFDLPNGTKCNGSACVCDSDTCRCNNNAIQNCTTVGTSSTCETPDSSNSCNLNLNSPSGSNCVGTGCAENNGFFSCTQSDCLISDGPTTCTGTSCECKVSGDSILCKKTSSCTGPLCSTLAPKRDSAKVRSAPSFPRIPSNIASIMDKKFDDGMPLTGNVVSTKGWGNDGVWGSSDGVSIDSSLCNDSTSSENVPGVKYNSSTDPRKGCLVTFKVF